MACLALNASFEPLTVVPAKRAIRLILDRLLNDPESPLCQTRDMMEGK